MKKLFALALLAAFSNAAEPTSKAFTGEKLSVRLIEDDAGIFPILTHEMQAKSDGGAIVTVFYYATVKMHDVTPHKLLLSKTAICPLFTGIDSGCDQIVGISLADVAWVKVKVFDSRGEWELGRPQKEKK